MLLSSGFTSRRPPANHPRNLRQRKHRQRATHFLYPGGEFARWRLLQRLHYSFSRNVIDLNQDGDLHWKFVLYRFILGSTPHSFCSFRIPPPLLEKVGKNGGVCSNCRKWARTGGMVQR